MPAVAYFATYFAEGSLLVGLILAQGTQGSESFEGKDLGGVVFGKLSCIHACSWPELCEGSLNI